MIYLWTGVPGAGKTLFALSFTEEMARREGRQVYYSGVKDLKVPGWIELSDEQVASWYDLPVGSIVLIDEVQRIWRPRAHGSLVPKSIAELETHRHRGIDLVLITQHPGLLDSNARKLVGIHRHVMRVFGLQRAVIHEWQNGVRDQPASPGARADSIKMKLAYPSQVFGWYKSAELHTHKARVPFRVVLLLVLPLVVAFLGWRLWVSIDHRRHPEKYEFNAPGQKPALFTQGDAVKKVSFVQSRVPEIPGLPFTAPAYAEVTKAKRAPYPAACVVPASRPAVCRCYTQDGTRMVGVALQTCNDVVRYGFFQDWRDPDEEKRRDREFELAKAKVVDTSHIKDAPSVVDAPKVVEGLGGDPQAASDGSAIALARQTVKAPSVMVPRK